VSSSHLKGSVFFSFLLPFNRPVSELAICK